jgi:arylsulfatase A
MICCAKRAAAVELIAVLLLGCPAALVGDEPGGPAGKPNVVMILADDMGWGDLRCHGNENIDTPNLDRLAAESVDLERFYVSPVCSPTRASMLTGRHYLRTGVRRTAENYETMRAEEVTIAEALKAAGYATGCFGKWHNGFYYPNTATGQGFDEFLGFRGGYFHDYFDPVLTRGNGEKVQTQGYVNDVLTDAAIDFIRRHRQGPFFCYLPFNTPHSPMQIGDELFEKYKQRGLNDYNAAIYGMVESIDENVGRVAEALEQLGLAESTIVVFFSDNGPNANRVDRFTAGLHGRKGSVHEGGVRSPCFFRWPGRLTAGRKVRHITAHIDLFDTLLELTGVPAPETLPRDGRSLVPLLEGRGENWPNRLLFSVMWSGQAVRSSQYRLVLKGRPQGLFDVEADPGATRDLSGDKPEVVAELKAAFDEFHPSATRSGPNTPGERLPIPVGHEVAPEVDIPAPYCFRGGPRGLRFSAGGWDWEWIKNWTKPRQFVWWELDVVRPGRYEVSIVYTCPAADIGSKMQLRIGGQTIPFTVDQVAEPDEITFPDRYPRWESNDRHWGRMVLGTAELDKGRTKLEIRAKKIAGRSPLELQKVFVRRAE